MRFILVFIFFSLQLSAQNRVGINNPSPQHDLDVSGDVNMTGQLLANGTAGAEGQVLAAQGDGTMAWVGGADYKNSKSFNSSNTWIVPAGVTEIMVEIWGGGGAGSTAGGGGSGAYTRQTYTNTSAGSIVTFTVGAGGTGLGNNGGTTNLSISGGGSIYASGGFSGSTSNAGLGAYANGSSSQGVRYAGMTGFPSEVDYQQTGTSSFVIKYSYGAGANSPMISYPTGGTPGFRITNAGAIVQNVNSSFGRMAGAGGGGGPGAADGSAGYVIIHW